MDKEILIQAGFTLREAEAYLALLELQEASVIEISGKTKENRTHLYDTLSSLLHKGLVSYVIKNGKKYFRPAPPNKIIDFLKEKENSVFNHLKELNELYKPRISKPIIEVYEGKEGIKTVLSDVLKEKKEWLSFGSTGKSPEIIPYFLEHFHKDRIKMKIPFRVIYDDDEFGRQRGKEASSWEYTKVRYMKKTSPTTTYTYGNKTVTIIWQKEKLLAIMIKDKDIADSFRSFFKLMWKIAKK